MIRSVLKRRGFSSSSLVRLLNESGARSLRTDATGVTSSDFPSWTGESVLSRMGFLRSFSGVSRKHNSSSGSSSSSSESDLEEVSPPPSRHNDIAVLLRSLNAYQFQQCLKELTNKERQMTYLNLLKFAKKTGATATLAESKQLCDALLDSGTIVRYGDRVYLDPAEIADSVRSVLPGTREETEALIEKLEKEIETTEKKKEEIKNKTRTYGDVLLYFGLVASICFLAAMYYCTYTAYSWDVMEPIAYLLTLVTAIIYYGYYVWYRRDFQFSSIITHVNKYQRKRVKIPDCSKYEAVKKKIEAHRAFLDNNRP